MKTLNKLMAVLALGCVAGGAQAMVITEVYGDKDCFGIAAQGGAACGQGLHYENDLGGLFFEDNREVGDPVETDIWETGSKSFTINVAGLPGTIISAALDIFHAGAGTIGGTNITINGVDYGAFGGGDNLSILSTYDISAILAGSNTVDITLSGGDGWSMDYAQIRAEVPVPATLALFGLALAGLGLTGRRKA